MNGALGHVNPDDLLRRYQQRAAEEIERRLPRGEPRQWLYEPLADYPGEPGRVCVPRCAPPPASAHGGLEDDALAAAAAIELAHSAFLVHDDIQDGSDWRRGQPTLHRRVGVPLALNAGDALAVLSLEVLRAGTGGLGRRLSLQVLDEFFSAMWADAAGPSDRARLAPGRRDQPLPP